MGLALKLIPMHIDQARQDRQPTAVETFPRAPSPVLDQSTADVHITLLEGAIRSEEVAIDQ
jgi:hypothetical protein